MTENEKLLIEYCLSPRVDGAEWEASIRAVRLERMPPEKVGEIERAWREMMDAKARFERLSDPFSALVSGPDGLITKWYPKWYSEKHPVVT